jgi:hypothetical protein
MAFGSPKRGPSLSTGAQIENGLAVAWELLTKNKLPDELPNPPPAPEEQEPAADVLAVVVETCAHCGAPMEELLVGDTPVLSCTRRCRKAKR